MPSSPQPQPRRTQVERRTEAEQALLQAAVRLFASKGIDQTSLAEIGEEAGYGRGLVNYHFGSKAVLVERLAELAQRAFVEDLVDLGAGHELETLLAIVDSYLALIRPDSTKARAFFTMWGAALPRDAALRPVFAVADARFRADVTTLVRAGQDARTIAAEVDPLGFAVTFVGLLRGIAAEFLVDPDGVDLDAASVACERFVRAALAPTDTSRPETAR
jgi:AcrR family transcriptional regulator